MTVKTVSDALIYLGLVAGALTGIGALIQYVMVRPLRRWIKEQVKDPLEKQVSPNGGSQESTRHLIEEVHDKVVKLDNDMEAARKYALENRDLATAAMSLAQQTSDRLDRLMEAQMATLEEKQ